VLQLAVLSFSQLGEKIGRALDDAGVAVEVMLDGRVVIQRWLRLQVGQASDNMIETDYEPANIVITGEGIMIIVHGTSHRWIFKSSA
jgi:hypothetical protein